MEKGLQELSDGQRDEKTVLERAEKMFQKLTSVIDQKLLKFIVVGVINTLVGMAIMFGLYNLAHCSYWVSSAANYILTSILSYFLNKYFTFQNQEKSVKQVVRFIINIAVCYVVAYGIAKPLVLAVFAGLGEQLQTNIAMLAGMVLFTGLNYLGQRFFAFKEETGESEK